MAGMWLAQREETVDLLEVVEGRVALETQPQMRVEPEELLLHSRRRPEIRSPFLRSSRVGRMTRRRFTSRDLPVGTEAVAQPWAEALPVRVARVEGLSFYLPQPLPTVAPSPRMVAQVVKVRTVVRPQAVAVVGAVAAPLSTSPIPTQALRRQPLEGRAAPGAGQALPDQPGVLEIYSPL